MGRGALFGFAGLSKAEMQLMALGLFFVVLWKRLDVDCLVLVNSDNSCNDAKFNNEKKQLFKDWTPCSLQTC